MATRSILAIAVAIFVSTRVAGEDDEKSFELHDGDYTLTMSFQIDDAEDPVEQKSAVKVSIDDRKVLIVNPDQEDYPFKGKLDGNDFRATLDDAGGEVTLNGKLTADDRLEGELMGESDDGKQNVSGTFTLVRQAKPSE